MNIGCKASVSSSHSGKHRMVTIRLGLPHDADFPVHVRDFGVEFCVWENF